MIRQALLSKDKTCRFTLTRRWGNKPGFALWGMLNPSDADAEVDDPTVKRCINFSRAWGYDALRIVNLVPFRSPKPAVMLDWYFAGDEMPSMMHENREHWAREMAEADIIIAAWGNVPDVLDSAASIFQTYASEARKQLWCLGRTKSGRPTHPLARGKHRAPDGASPEVFSS